MSASTAAGGSSYTETARRIAVLVAMQQQKKAVSEALVLNSILKIKTDSAEKRQRRLESIKTHGPIVEAPSEATTQPTADDWNV